MSTSTNHFTFNCFLVQLLNNTDSFSTPRIPQIPHEDLSWHPRQRCYHQFQRSSLQSWNTGRCFYTFNTPGGRFVPNNTPGGRFVPNNFYPAPGTPGGGYASFNNQGHPDHGIPGGFSTVGSHAGSGFYSDAQSWQQQQQLNRQRGLFRDKENHVNAPAPSIPSQVSSVGGKSLLLVGSATCPSMGTNRTAQQRRLSISMRVLNSLISLATLLRTLSILVSTSPLPKITLSMRLRRTVSF